MFNRRSFLKTGLAALPLTSITDISMQGLTEPKPPALDSVLPGKLFAPDTTKPWQQTVRRVGQLNMTEHDPLGEQKISMKIPAGTKVDRVELLRAEHDVRFKTTDRGVEFVIPRIDDYEVAAVYCS